MKSNVATQWGLIKPQFIMMPEYGQGVTWDFDPDKYIEDLYSQLSTLTIVYAKHCNYQLLTSNNLHMQIDRMHLRAEKICVIVLIQFATCLFDVVHSF